MIVLITCKNEEDPIKHEGARVLTTLYIDFSDALTRAGNSIVSGLIWFKFEVIQAFMHVLVSCKNEDVPINNKGARVVTTIIPL